MSSSAQHNRLKSMEASTGLRKPRILLKWNGEQCEVSRCSFIIMGKEYWADSYEAMHAMRSALDPTYGVLIVRPPREIHTVTIHGKRSLFMS